MARKTKLGPVGNGWVDIRNDKWFAFWKTTIADPTSPNGVRKVHGGQYEIGPLRPLTKKKGRDLTAEEIKQARDHEKEFVKADWEKIAYDIMHNTPAAARPIVSRIEGITSNDPTFGELLHFGYVVKKRDLWKETTRESVEGTYVPKLMERFGNVRISLITKSDIENWLTYLAVKGKDPENNVGYSRTIIQHCRDYVTAVTAIAYEHKFIDSDPGLNVKLPTVMRSERHRHLKMSDFIKFVIELPTPKDELMSELLYFAGMRRGELFAVRWAAFDGRSMKVASQINSRGKEADPKDRPEGTDYIVLPEALLKKIHEYKRWCGKVAPTDFIFPSRAKTPMGQKNWISRIAKPAAEAAGLLHIDYHSFRRGVATKMFNHLMREGTQKVQEHLRHGSPDVTRRYIQADEEGDAVREKLLDDLYTNYLADRAIHEEGNERYEWVKVKIKKPASPDKRQAATR